MEQSSFQLLRHHRRPRGGRALWELTVSLAGLALFGALMVLSQRASYTLTLLLAVPTALFVVRLFTIQHDCGHGSFFPQRWQNDRLGAVLGIITLTPYRCWRRFHAQHHASSSDLDRRGYGDIRLLTTTEYDALGRWRKLAYRLYRHPLVMFGIGPLLHFGVRQRLTYYVPTHWKAERRSVHATNLVLALVFGLGVWWLGPTRFLQLQLPVTAIASSVGVWLFYVQHAFAGTYWARRHAWDPMAAALRGAGYYRLPRPLAWITCDIGLHHVHHLDSRVPSYGLAEARGSLSVLRAVGGFSLRDSLAFASLKLWDESLGQMVSFAKR